MRTLIVILLVAFLGLQYKLWLGDGSYIQWKKLEQKISEQTEINATLANRNDALEADIRELKQGEQALEEQARYELGMVKDDEQYYQFAQ